MNESLITLRRARSGIRWSSLCPPAYLGLDIDVAMPAWAALRTVLLPGRLIIGGQTERTIAGTADSQFAGESELAGGPSKYSVRSRILLNGRFARCGGK